MNFARKLKVGSMILASALLAISPVMDPLPQTYFSTGVAHAEGLGDLFGLPQGQHNRTKSKKKKKAQNDDLGLMIIQGIGLGLAIGGVAEGKAAPAIIGTVLATAPVIFQNEMKRKYKADQGWSGCTDCNRQRVLVVPGRKVTSEQQKQIIARIRADVKDQQSALKSLGYYDGKVDGDYGAGTRAAVKLFQKAQLDDETGKLTAQQRSELFRQANAKGFEPESEIAKATLAPVNTLASAPSGASPQAAPTIKEFKLAESQLQKFSKDVLQYGSISQVKDVKLLNDGQIEVTVDKAGTNMAIRGGIESVTIKKHELSDEWVQISMLDANSGELVPLNTIDSLNSSEEASKWRDEAGKEIVLLEKLTERNSTQPPAIVVADTGAKPEQPTAVAPNALATTNAVLTSDGSGAKVSEVASYAQTPSSQKQCSQNLYLSFNFPTGTGKIDHYNITPPEGTVMTDNGNETGFMVGPCVQGVYSYKYVVIDHDKAKKNWADQVQEGSFEVASAAGQCEVDLNVPQKSATLHCY